jgi:hypothetical protein
MKNTIEENNFIFNSKDIDVKKLLNDLENIGNEKEKGEFIKNYSRIREEIKIFDNILNNDNNNNINELESKTINSLFEILEQNENKIFDDEELNVEELKLLVDVCNVLEKKINDDTISIMEI